MEGACITFAHIPLGTWPHLTAEEVGESSQPVQDEVENMSVSEQPAVSASLHLSISGYCEL